MHAVAMVSFFAAFFHSGSFQTAAMHLMDTFVVPLDTFVVPL